MGRKIIIEQDAPSASDAVIEVVSSLGGIAFAGCTSMYLDKFLPVAVTTLDKVVRYTTVGLGGLTAGVGCAKAIETEMVDAREVAIMAKLQASGLLTKEDVKAVEEEKEASKASAKK